MDIEESKWVSKATDNINKYLNRGGKLKGDDPQLLGGTNFLNTIGIAMGLPLQDPQKWNESEKQKALNNELVYFEGDAKKAIDVIADQIRYACDGNDQNYVTILPIELYSNGKLYELPVFRVQRYKDSKKHYVDNLGRIYDSVKDWFNNNKLPPCKMGYPYDLKLILKPETNDVPYILIDDTPSARVGSKVIDGIDIATSVVGIVSGIGLIFVSGGLATPLVAAGVTAAVWGTGRATQQIIDKATHGENVSPFKNIENSMLWLGIAANVASFGAMGASMRLASLAARGREISRYFKILVEVMNGTNIVVSGSAIIDTTIFLYEYHDQLSSLDILIYVASMAFWTKGVFTYKTAGALIKHTQDYAFKVISNELNSEDTNRLNTFRNKFNNDAQLIREFHKITKSNINIQTFCQVIIDTETFHGNIQFDELGNLILTEGQKYSIEFLSKLPQNVRQNYFDVIANLRADQIELLESIRHTVNDDMKLILALHTAEIYCNITSREATEHLLKFWVRYNHLNKSTNIDISFGNGSVLLGKAPPLQLNQLQELSNSMLHFVTEHLAQMDETTSRQWTPSIPILLQLESYGMFSACKVTKIIPSGRAVVLLNDNLEISIYKLFEIDSYDCSNILNLIGKLSPFSMNNEIPKETRLLIQKYRLQLEGNRRETVNWIINHVHEDLLPILDSKLQNFERDRIFTFKSTITTAKAMPYINEMLGFVSELRPRNVSEMVSYGEYVITCVETQKRNLEVQLRSGQLQLPANTKKADFLRQIASEVVFSNPFEMRRQWEATLDLVRGNVMVGPVDVGPQLNDDNLVAAVRYARIGFGSEASAAYHVLKHPTDPPSAYVIRANEVIRGATRWQVSLTQDGDARLVRLESPEGSAILLERDGRVLLCTFSPKTAKA